MCRRSTNEKDSDTWGAIAPVDDAKDWSREFSERTRTRLNRMVDSYNDRITEGIGSILGASPLAGFFEAAGAASWAYPVPSANQYNTCKDQNGISGWTREGVWRCLLPSSEGKMPSVRKDEFFGDYTGLLDYRRKLLLAERRMQGAQVAKVQDSQSSVPGSSTASAVSKLSSLFDLPSLFSSSSQLDTTNRKLVSEADTAGKRVVGERVETETVTKPDGSLDTKRRVVKYYDDNTASVSDTEQSGSWLWK